MSSSLIYDKRGLTIVDVVAIILILLIVVGFLLPVLDGRRQPPHKAICKSNLKNIGLCAKMYSQDYD
ncbi:hypothetical protein ACFL01_05105, partial [Planctomycetota bacterium]